MNLATFVQFLCLTLCVLTASSAQLPDYFPKVKRLLDYLRLEESRLTGKFTRSFNKQTSAAKSIISTSIPLRDRDDLEVSAYLDKALLEPARLVAAASFQYAHNMLEIFRTVDIQENAYNLSENDGERAQHLQTWIENCRDIVLPALRKSKRSLKRQIRASLQAPFMEAERIIHAWLHYKAMGRPTGYKIERLIQACLSPDQAAILGL